MKTVSVYPPTGYQQLQSILEGLSQLEPVRFQEVSGLQNTGGDALILVGVPFAVVQQAVAARRPVFAFTSEGPQLSGNREVPIQFARSALLDPVLRGQQLHDSVPPIACQPFIPTADVLASKGDHPVWTHIRFAGATADIVAYGPPSLGDLEYLFQSFRRGRFMPLLPLLHFLRQVTAGGGFQRPSLRACLMFDDPNLHWSSFGHIAYDSLVESAKRHNYHVSFATIPLDAWFVHQPTARLFRENTDHLSVLIHGNNHTRRELTQGRTEESRLKLGAQALRRIDRFEALARLEVARVMAAPHGACDGEMAGALLRLGFEAACISRGSLMSYNRHMKWPLSVGLNLAEFLGGALPVIPRFGLTNDYRTEIVLAAYMGQAIIPVGHHDDVRKGYGLLEDLARFINNLGQISWMNLRDIARSNYLQRTCDRTLWVRAFSRRLRLTVSQPIQRLVIEHAWRHADDNPETVLIERMDQPATYPFEGRQASITVDAPGPMEVVLRCVKHIDFRTVSAPPRLIWPPIRRLLAEGRDRLRPLLSPVNPSH